MRFEVMDRNNDGEISRDEWRGSARSFEVHDWNGDGRLSGDEVRIGARRNTRLDEGDRRSIRASTGGRRYLGLNDDHLDDNSGEFTVTVGARPRTRR